MPSNCCEVFSPLLPGRPRLTLTNKSKAAQPPSVSSKSTNSNQFGANQTNKRTSRRTIPCRRRPRTRLMDAVRLKLSKKDTHEKEHQQAESSNLDYCYPGTCICRVGNSATMDTAAIARKGDSCRHRESRCDLSSHREKG